ncbi:MAG: hypothetical protein IJU66_06525 [Oscillospiraceae bacterium]|nr:hypothetical protein [Oscillospiraceae bacterium]
MIKKRSKAVSVLLTLAMALSLIPAAAFPARADDLTPDLTIANDADWAAFAEAVNNGTSDYSGKLVVLDGDVTARTPVGVQTTENDKTTVHAFKGTFDGGGHTLTAAIDEMVESGNEEFPYIYDGAPQGTAPFRVIEGATVRNLKVAGEVKGGWHTAGVVGFSRGSNNLIENCYVTAAVRNDKYIGGILGHGTNSSVTIQNCVFKGFLLPGNEAKGAILGWGDAGGTKLVRHCLYVWPAQYGSDAQNDYQLGFYKKSDGSVTVDDCYYRTLYGTENSKLSFGKLAYTKAEAQSQRESYLYKKLSFYGESVDYYTICTYSGVKEEYFYTGEDIQIVPTADGEEITNGVTITYTYYPNGENGVPAEAVIAPGNYLMTVTGDGDDFIGTKRFEFDVVDSVPYLDTNGTQKTLNMAGAGVNARLVTADSKEWGAAGETWWYVANSSVTFRDGVTVQGSVNLILCDGVTVEAQSAGVRVGADSKLTVWAQSEGNSAGKLNATARLGNYAGIGGSPYEDCGEIVINGGSVEAEGGSNAAGIGGGGPMHNSPNEKGRAGGTITINGGTVKAESNSCGAGIGGGRGASGGTITINGGYVDTTSNTGNPGAAGIGGGAPNGAENGTGGDGGTIVINGGTIIAQGRNGGSATGGGARAAGTTSITINGGKITAGLNACTGDGTDVGVGIPVDSTGTCTVRLNLSKAGDYIQTINQYGYGPTGFNGTVTLAAGGTLYNGITAYRADSAERVFTADELATFRGALLTPTATLAGLRATLSNASKDPTEPTVIRLTEDLTATADDKALFILPGTYVVLDLNGHSIVTDCANADAQKSLTTFYVNGDLTVTDTSEAKNGAIRAINNGADGTYGSSGCFAMVLDEKDCYGTLSLEHGTVSGYSCGVALYGGVFGMSGGAITGNAVGVSLYAGAFDMTGGAITGNAVGAEVLGRDQSTFTVSGTPFVFGNGTANVFLLDGTKEESPTITVTDALRTGASIGVSKGVLNQNFQSGSQSIRQTGGVFAVAADEYKSGRLDADDAKFFSSDANFPIEVNQAGRLTLVKASWASLQTALDNAAASGDPANRVVTLTTDYIAEADDVPLHIDDGKTVTLDLNGHVIDRAASAAESVEPKSEGVKLLDSGENYFDGCAIVVSGGRLVLRDSGTTPRYGYRSESEYVLTKDKPVSGDYDVFPTGGVITGGDGEYGSVLACYGGRIEMEGGAIAGNHGSCGGGVTAERGGSFCMSGGMIAGNDATYGGGANVRNGGAFFMEAGTIADNAAICGGGVYIGIGGTFVMGEAATSGTINLQGEAAAEPPVIRGNTAEMMLPTPRPGPGPIVLSSEKPMLSGGWTPPGGGGVFVDGNGEFRMSGGKISGNFGTCGGGVVLLDGAQFKVSGGATVSGNTFAGFMASGVGGGAPYEEQGNVVLLSYPSESVLASGDPAPDVFLTVAGALSGRIGVTRITLGRSASKSTGIFAFPAGIASSGGNDPVLSEDGSLYAKITASDLACFFSDDPSFGVRLDPDGYFAYLAAAEFSMTCRIENGTLTYTVSDAPAGATLIAAWYNAAGRMLGTKTVDVGGLAESTGTFAVDAAATNCKLVLVDGATYAPLCEPSVYPIPNMYPEK